MSGRFVVLEGIEGVGKSTQLQLAREHLERLGHEVVRLRVACRSNLFDANTIISQSPCRLSRMPDELEELRQEFADLGYHMIYHTTMPAVSMAELDKYYRTEASSGFTI